MKIILKLIKFFFIILILLAIWFFLYVYSIKDNILIQYNHFQKLPIQIKEKVLDQKFVKTYINDIKENDIINLIESKININEKVFKRTLFKDWISIKYNIFSKNNEQFNFTDIQYNKFVIGLVMKKEKYDFTKHINQFNYSLNNGKLLITKKTNIIDNWYYEQLKNKLKIKTSKINYKEVLNDILQEKEIKWIKLKEIKFDYKKLEWTYIPFLDKEMILISNRIRNTFYKDKDYRRYNIKQIYNSVKNNVFIFNPWTEFSFETIYNKNDNWKKYKVWYAIIWWKEKPIYWWGVCWAATGIYQWTLQNSWLEIKSRNHSIWYWNLYSSKINWKNIYTPWLDSTYFWGVVDLKIKNISNYPIWMINKINKTKNQEENYTVSFKQNKLINKKILFLKRKWNCYYWKIWDKSIYSCYRKIQ